ncbi:sigma factor-like helix-turn-helix DNA-binding protein [uncultured Sphingomonas sp.]|uniref:sigma factor-like helix-turn-helix DNA-binding protein n=1 Tax=uncultured Sphingomonas sp. TaxID=158754 RepID=UPI0025E11CED|nr:sigma factor-like helix-turn-helix DNA-binding protein [uncultured Sphingomonas sp.]
MVADPTHALSDLEKEVLRLFMTVSDQKELARRIGRSPATVEQRLARARRKLGVGRSIDAALLLAQHEGGGTYGTAIYGETLHGGEPESGVNAAPSRELDGTHAFTLFPTRGRPWNSLPAWLRLVMIVGGVLALMIATVAALSIGQALTSIVRQLQ